MDKETRPREDTIFGYLEHEFDSFVLRPISDVDSLALSCLSYLLIPVQAEAAWTSEGMPAHELLRADWFDAMTRRCWAPASILRLLVDIVASPRFSGMRVSDYEDIFDESRETQFSACTLRFPTGDAYLSFMGTDNTLVGWKEDFNMAFSNDVPSQRAALAYLERVAPTLDGDIYLGGHSKGGNIAVYATMNCTDEVALRIVRAFSHDGPGFLAETLDDARWEERSHLVSKTVPKSSLIGMFFERQEDYSVVESTLAGPLQHDPFSWVVKGCDFVRVSDLNRGASLLDVTLNQWILSMTREEREAFVNTLFVVLNAGGQDTFFELSRNWQTTLPSMIEALSSLAPDERASVTRAISLLFRALLPQIDVPKQLATFGSGDEAL